MSQPILLKDKTPDVDPNKIGISYSGGGPRVLIEIGIARAFVKKGIIPQVISGASAGALAGTAHALDVRNGTGLDLAAKLLERLSNAFVGLEPVEVVERAIVYRDHTKSLGDNGPIGPLVRDGIQDQFGLRDVTLGTFEAPTYPKLMIVATDLLTGNSVWFADDTPIEQAVVATSAIPGVFPWLPLRLNGIQTVLVDGGVVSNQPLSNLALEGCGTIYACAVGGDDAPVEPTNALDNAMRSVHKMMHQCTKLEEDYVRLKLGDRGTVHHIHPEVDFPVQGFNFTPDLIRQVMDDACAKTLAWLDEAHPD
ncbi:MAG TPA: patatin-like phospholipase family protein [Chloroflexota bacterium]|nr:patatin-like phospholipase family protein [Chloroflexota bacterium]